MHILSCKTQYSIMWSEDKSDSGFFFPVYIRRNVTQILVGFLINLNLQCLQRENYYAHGWELGNSMNPSWKSDNFKDVIELGKHKTEKLSWLMWSLNSMQLKQERDGEICLTWSQCHQSSICECFSVKQAAYPERSVKKNYCCPGELTACWLKKTVHCWKVHASPLCMWWLWDS